MRLRVHGTKGLRKMNRTIWKMWWKFLPTVVLAACQGAEFSGAVSNVDGEGAGAHAMQTETEEASFYDPYLPGMIGGSAVVARGPVACGKSLDGQWFCWGPNEYGIHGADVPRTSSIFQTSKPTKPIAGLPGEPSDIAVGKRHACALIGSKAYCFGLLPAPSVSNPAGGQLVYVSQPTAVEGDFLQLAAGTDFTCGIEKNPYDQLKSGRVKCWGINNKGQLGVGDNLPKNPWVPQIAKGDTPGWLVSDLYRVSTIVAGDSHACALRDAHDNRPAAFYCWGANDKGQLGLGFKSNFESIPQRLGSLTQVDSTITSSQHRKISAYGNRTCAINFGNVYCWGDNTDGAFGFISPDLRRELDTPTLVQRYALNNGAFRDIAVGNRHQCVSRVRNAISPSLYCWGANDFNQLGNDSVGVEFPVLTPKILEVDREAADMALGDDFTCITYAETSYTTGINVRCFGRNDVGQVGRGVIGASMAYPIKVQFPSKTTVQATASMASVKVRDVAVGISTTCATTDAKELRCFGSNFQGALGFPLNIASVSEPVLAVPGLQVTQASNPGPNNHSCAVTETGDVYCWGKSDVGQTGQGAPSYSSFHEPRLVLGIPEYVSQVINLHNASCALTYTGKAWCWGSNSMGLLGYPADSNLFSGHPIEVPGQYSRLAGQGSTACGITRANASNGGVSTVECWGDNAVGQTGLMDGQTKVHVPRTVPGVTHVTDLAGDIASFCAVTENGSIACWGLNFGGSRSGIASDTRLILPPTFIDLPLPAKKVSVGHELACSITVFDDVYCWGRASAMQDLQPVTGGVLGPNLMMAPATSAGQGPLKAKTVSTNFEGTCAVTTDDRLVCWGQQSKGRLGNGVESDAYQRSPFYVTFSVLTSP